MRYSSYINFIQNSVDIFIFIFFCWFNIIQKNYVNVAFNPVELHNLNDNVLSEIVKTKVRARFIIKKKTSFILTLNA